MNSLQNQPSNNVTSFRKKGANSLNIRGTRISTQNSQLSTSTGSSTLDFFIGGGLAVGTICLIEEDHYNSYSSLLAKIFLAEGVANNHNIFVSGGIKSSKEILKELPSIHVPERKVWMASIEGISNTNMKIAWRYESQAVPLDFHIKTESHNHRFDLSKNLPQEILEKCTVSSWDPTQNEEPCSGQENKFIGPPYSNLLEKINSEIVTGGFQTSNSKHENIMRIGLLSLGSPLWNCSSGSESELVRFLYSLKFLLRKSFAVATVTVPSHVVKNTVLRNRIRQICDTVISLESFVGSNKKSNPLFKDFDGLLQVVKLPVLNTFMYPVIVSDLAFKLKKKEFIIQRLHLPPDFEDSQETTSMSCSGKPSKLDF